MKTVAVLVSSILLMAPFQYAQTVSPIIAEYKGRAEGRIALTNNTLLPLAVVLEPRSFSISPDGNGIYRPLDAEIQVKLSSTSVRIEPAQTYYVFYKAKARKLPAWFTIYSTFSAIQPATEIDVRILLPHTVYIYPQKPKSKVDTFDVTRAAYSMKAGTIICEIANNTDDLERVEEVRVVSGSHAITSPGFPLLPGTKRLIDVEWKESDPPRDVILHMNRSSIKLKLSVDDECCFEKP